MPDCPHLGAIQYCVIGHENQGAGKGWNLESVKVADTEGANFAFANTENDGWLESSEGDGSLERRLAEAAYVSTGSIRTGKETTYSLTICTGTVPSSGTSANIFVSLHGTEGDSGARQLPAKRGQFDSAAISKFHISAVDLGALEFIRVRHDGKGLGAGWFLERVDVTSEISGKTWNFPCNRWLDEKQDDGKTSRDIYAE